MSENIAKPKQKRDRKLRTVIKKVVIPEETILQVLSVLENGGTLREAGEVLNINEDTIYSWKYRNYNNFAERAYIAQLKGSIQRAQEKMDSLMKEDYKEDGKLNTRLLQIQQKEAEFIRSNVIEAQKYYSNRPQVNVQVNLPQPIIDLGNISGEEKA